MRNSFKFLLCLIFVGFAVPRSNFAVAQDAPAPQLVIANPVVDFGNVKEGTNVSAHFSLLNNGGSTLEIGKVQTSCGCVVASLGATSLVPGAETLLAVNFDTTGFSGEKTRTIRVNSNDPKQPWSVLTLSGKVTTDVTVDPRRIYFGSVLQDQTATRTVKVRLTPGVILKEVSSRSEFVEVSSGTEAGLGSVITVSLKPGIPVGNFQSRIVIRTTSEKQPTINIPVFAKIQGDVTADPQEASFGLIEGPLSADTNISIQLTNRGSGPITISSVESATDTVGAKIDPIHPGFSFTLTVSLLRGSVGPVRSQVVVSYVGADAKQKRLVIPVFAILSRKSD